MRRADHCDLITVRDQHCDYNDGLGRAEGDGDDEVEVTKLSVGGYLFIFFIYFLNLICYFK